MTPIAIAKASLQRVVRDRRALFFMIALPILVIIIIGATVRGYNRFSVGVVDLGSGRAGHDLVAALADSSDLTVHAYRSTASATTAVARGEVSLALVLPASMDAGLRAGRSVAVTALTEEASTTQEAAYNAVASVVASQGSRLQAARFATSVQGGTLDQNLSRAASLEARVPVVAVETLQVDARSNTLPEGFSYSTPTMLVLFVFINTLTGAASIIETRRLGMYERMSVAPVRPRAIVAGEAMSLVTLSLLQALLIVGTGALLFGVSWGDPLAAATLVVLWAVVAAGVGLLAGTLFRSPEQASALGPTLGILFGMLGGCMWPLSIVSPAVRAIGHATPHAWAVDAWTALIARGAGFAGIATDLAVLVAFAVALMALATWRLGRRLV
ncbi:MAG TPA: ABC transporter permease [Acidimicrobiales bacterium]|nr:ABC transporter permease [Acidimicrobiales bacterium]